jgi:hypothetical protein
MTTRQFAVRCAPINLPASSPAPSDTPAEPSTAVVEQLKEELMAGGLQEIVVESDGEGGRVTIRGLAPAGESSEAARALVEDQIYDATLDLIILEPGVWVDESIH